MSSVAVTIPRRGGDDDGDRGDQMVSTPPSFTAESPSFSMLGDPRTGDMFVTDWEAPLVRKVFVASAEIDMATTELVRYTFVWKYPCADGELRGSFTSPAWGVGIPLDLTSDGLKASVTVLLPPGEHTYKFVIDGEWHLVSFLPIVVGDDGNANNLLVLDAAEAKLFSPDAAIVPTTAM